MVRTITRVLTAVSSGQPGAEDELLGLVHQELKVMAHRALGPGAAAQDLHPTALVNEAYLRLFGKDHVDFENRRHFFFAAAGSMRNILVDEARRRQSLKRGGGRRQQVLAGDEVAAVTEAAELLDIHEALILLKKAHPRAADIVILRFFGGQSFSDIEALMDISSATARRDWALARAWLRRHLGGEHLPEKENR